jgi:hypothetical protein
MSHVTQVYRDRDGDRLVIEVGGVIQVNTGGHIVGPTGAPATAIADATGGTTTDAEARAALNAVLAALRAVGIVASA